MSELSSILQPLRAKFVGTIPQRIAELEALLDRMDAGAPEGPALDAIGQEAHRISGVAETLGFQRLGQLAFQIDQQVVAVRQRRETPQRAWARTEPVVEALIDELDAQLDS